MPSLGINVALPYLDGDSGPSGNAGALYRRPDTTSRFLRPGGVFLYRRP